jgi:hypothetical protein
MDQHFFMLYGTNQVTAYVATDAELIQMARNNPEFEPANHETLRAKVDEAQKVLTARYKVFEVYPYSLEGMQNFLDNAREHGELVGLSALELAENFADEVKSALMVALTEHQQIVMDRVQFPIAGDVRAFSVYQDDIATIRGLSIKGLYEYVDNGDKSPD